MVKRSWVFIFAAHKMLKMKSAKRKCERMKWVEKNIIEEDGPATLDDWKSFGPSERKSSSRLKNNSTSSTCSNSVDRTSMTNGHRVSDGLVIFRNRRWGYVWVSHFV